MSEHSKGGRCDGANRRTRIEALSLCFGGSGRSGAHGARAVQSGAKFGRPSRLGRMALAVRGSSLGLGTRRICTGAGRSTAGGVGGRAVAWGGHLVSRVALCVRSCAGALPAPPLFVNGRPPVLAVDPLSPTASSRRTMHRRPLLLDSHPPPPPPPTHSTHHRASRMRAVIALAAAAIAAFPAAVLANREWL